MADRVNGDVGYVLEAAIVLLTRLDGEPAEFTISGSSAEWEIRYCDHTFVGVGLGYAAAELANWVRDRASEQSEAVDLLRAALVGAAGNHTPEDEARWLKATQVDASKQAMLDGSDLPDRDDRNDQ